MTNHVHLLLTPADSQGCALLMRDLGRSYVRYFNDRHGRTGSLWEGRFRSCLVESPRYVLGCYRYIELNPVRAALVESAAEYPWSSHSANAAGEADGLITPHVEYLALGERMSERRANYLGLFGDQDAGMLTREIRKATEGGYPLVSEGLKAQLASNGIRVERGKPGPRVVAPEEPPSGQFSLAE